MANYDSIMPAAQSFYARLASENTKAWWQANKPEYDSAIKAPAQDLLQDMAAHLEKQLNEPIATKIFRPHRDVRFSKDKTPYTTHLHLLWSVKDVPNSPGWFFGVSPDYIRIGWGWMAFSPAQVATWRDAVVMTKIPDLIEQTNAELPEPELKRVPTGFDKDHVQKDHLRRKSLALWTDAKPENIWDQMVAHFDTIQPVHNELMPLLS